MDVMQNSRQYDWAFGLGYLYSYILTVPHSIAINLAFPTEIAKQGQTLHLLQAHVHARCMNGCRVLQHQNIVHVAVKAQINHVTQSDLYPTRVARAASCSC